jgi:thiol-disulfide isomerase/thioredoxin
MKKSLYCFIVVLIFSSFNHIQKTEFVILQGKIQHFDASAVSVSGKGINHEISIDKEGNFADTLMVSEGYFSLKYNGETTNLYLKPGFNLYLTFDTEQFDETIKYKGIGALENNFIAQRILKEENDLPPMDKLYLLEGNEFLKIITKYKVDVEIALKQDDLDKNFVLNELDNCNYEFISKIQKYPTYHKHFAKKDTVLLETNFLKPLATIDMDNGVNFDKFDSYKGIVQQDFLDNLEDDDSGLDMIQALKNYKSQNIRNALLKSIAYELTPTQPNMEALYNEIMMLSTDEEFKLKLTNKFDKLKDLTMGKPSPKFEFKNTQNELVSLDDLKNNIVYVDVWATWCGPCKREIPALKELELEFRDSAIKFVSISVDKEKDYQTWLNMVAEKELKGIQLFADKDWNSEFVKNYAIDGIPRFILIDKQGNIISADAPRPSSGDEIKNLLKEYL